jgi:predicted DNA-binding protein
MYNTYIMKRTQIYLDELLDSRLAKRAKASKRTKSDLIREAVGAYLTGPEDQETQLLGFRAAVRAAAGAAPRLPEGRRYVEDMRKADAERERDLNASRQ